MKRTTIDEALAESAKYSAVVSVNEPTSNSEAAESFRRSMEFMVTTGERWGERFDEVILDAIGVPR